MRKMLVLLAMIGCFFAVNTNAADFGTALGIAIANVPPGADVAGMGNAWVATPEFSSNNPAVMPKTEDFHIGAQGTYARIDFKNGLGVDLYSGTASGKVLKGILQVSYSHADSNTGRADFGLDPGFNPDMKLSSVSSLLLQYGVRVGKSLLLDGDELYVGITYEPVSKSKLTLFLQGQEGFVSESDGYSIGGGFLYKPAAKLSFGGNYLYSRDEVSDADMLGETAESVSKTHQYRLGAGLQILPMTFLAADFQHLDIDGEKKDQFFAGVEQGIIKDILYLYGGWAADGPTAGLGIYFEHGGLNLAYMHKPFEDAEPFLGKAEVYMASAFVNF